MRRRDAYAREQLLERIEADTERARGTVNRTLRAAGAA